MSKLEKILAMMRESPTNVRYDDLHSVCCRFFDRPRHEGGSHAIFKTPWQGDPRVNIQCGPNGKAKPYQVRQVLAAIDELLRLTGGEE